MTSIKAFDVGSLLLLYVGVSREPPPNPTFLCMISTYALTQVLNNYIHCLGMIRLVCCANRRPACPVTGKVCLEEDSLPSLAVIIGSM